MDLLSQRRVTGGKCGSEVGGVLTHKKDWHANSMATQHLINTR